ncbi:Mo25-like protein [Aureobasidium pullulans]|uniref:Mo25-like protein n=1 Tax=Aureobasidium pullulans TaxID=5580 RepID=A0A4S9Y7B8_AURPU|nr:Mo25-like protein [Aureobasidium pullulans]
MAFLFARSKARTNQELTRSTKELMLKLIAEDKPSQKVSDHYDPSELDWADDGQIEEEVARNLGQMKVILQGTPELDVSPDQVFQLVNLLVTEDLLRVLAENIHRLPFESRKDTQTIISTVLRYKQPGEDQPIALQYIITTRPEVIIALCNGYDRRESAMPCGGILKEALKHDAVTALILYDEPSLHGQPLDLGSIDTDQPASGQGVFWKFFDWIDKSLFEVSTDAFDTFRQILVRHKPMVSKFIDTNFDLFFDKYNNILIKSESYVTKRQSIKLLGEVLLDRQFYEIMTRYVESGDNLKLIMWQLKDDRKMVQYEAFHVFKIFAANPNKSADVKRLLTMNRQRLLDFLPNFLADRTEDDQFSDEKSYLIKQIKLLPQTPSQQQRTASQETSR